MLADIDFPPKSPLIAEGIANALATAEVTAEVDEVAAFIKLDAEVDRGEDARARSSISYKSEIDNAGDISDDSSEPIWDSDGVGCTSCCLESLRESSLFVMTCWLMDHVLLIFSYVAFMSEKYAK